MLTLKIAAQMAGLATALRAGLAPARVLGELERLAAQDPESPFQAMLTRAQAASSGAESAGVTQGHLLSAFERFLGEEASPEAAVILQQIGEDLRQMRGADRRNVQTPAVFRASTVQILVDALAHHLNNAHQTVELKMQRSRSHAEELQEILESASMLAGVDPLRDPMTTGLQLLAQLNDHLDQGKEALARGTEFVKRVEALVASGVNLDEIDLSPLFDNTAPAGSAPVSEVQPVRDMRSISDPILYVEDEDDTAEMMLLMMGSRGFSNFIHARSGEEALDLFDKKPFRVVVTDYRMGRGMDGIELARRLRKKNPGLPIIFISGSENEITRRLTEEESRAFVIFGKPLDYEKFERSLKALLTHTPSQG